MAEFRMPQLGADMTAGKLLHWRKKVGDSIKRGDIIADVETEKADIEVEVFATGVIEKFLVQPGEKVPVGTPLALIREEGINRVVVPSAEVPRAPAQMASVPPATSPPPIGVPSESGRLRISPAARRLAAEHGIDPASITGTGPGGRITLEDIELASPAKAPLVGTQEGASRQDRMRQVIAAAMARSKREIPHYYLSTTIDMGRATEWLTQLNLKRSVEERVLYGALLLKAVALALCEVPELNAWWMQDKAVKHDDIHVGVAISLRGGGLIAPAIHRTDRLSLGDLMQQFRDLVQRARAGSLRSSELGDATITVTSLGDRGVETVFGVIYPPQVALVGFGKIVERPWAFQGQIGVRPLMSATLSADHRVSDGHRGALFLTAIERLLQEPEKL